MRHRLFLVLLVVFSQPVLAQSVCSQYADRIDTRLASADYSDKQVQDAQLMKKQFHVMCQMGMPVPDSMLDDLDETLDELLPLPDETKTDPPPRQPGLGTPRDDLDRFLGFYGEPDRDDEYRVFFVRESCDGYLVAGALWGGASDWWMRSISDTVFEAGVFGGEKLRFEFPAQARSMVHQLDYMPNPLPWVGPLTDGWQACVPHETGGR